MKNNLDLHNEHTVHFSLLADEAGFEKVYKYYLRPLHAYAMVMLKDEDMAKGIVQNVFLKLWERKEKLSAGGSLQAYLYGAVYNECLNNLRHQKVKNKHQQFVTHSTRNEGSGIGGMELLELKEKLQEALNELPEKCRT